ncbi:hypothetical protein UCDDA912_g09101 [Diaporthe ampelina]|uniref:Prefoldin subunit n=1 Tax=Diaporthe ampelina TaxID=1214573 RepID=A0A0G2H6X3_9PEZI|nr:hypothetical protein UCDDA912_g09101 [Diaporthe ampelina]
METSVSKLLQGQVEWETRLRRSTYKGINPTDMDHWLWILEAEETDAKVERFVSTDRHKPIFVLMAILRTDEYMRKGSSLVKLKRLDGTEEREDPEEWLSRSVKAGILKKQEGYTDDMFDHALDSLGGAVLQDSITVQTRSGAPRFWSGDRRSLSIFSAWAAKVKATRNAYEAWQMCQEPPLPNLKPNFQVYAEMFSKLFSAEIDYTSSILPGAAKEVYPPHHVNLTEFERERLRPLSVDELYERMLRDGNRPVKHCLTLLVRNASTVEKAAQYLHDSPLDQQAVESLTKALNPTYDSVKQIPVRVFHAYVGLLCSRQARRRWAHNPNAAEHRPRPEVLARYDHLKRAVQLVCVRSGPRRSPAPAPWHTVMRALAHRKLVLRPWCSQEEDNVEALRMMLSLFNAYKMSEGIHPIVFDALARCTHKALGDDGTAAGPAKNAQQLIATAHQTLKSTLRELISPVQAPSERIADSLPPLYHELSAANIQTYLEMLARLGDVNEAVQLIEWVLLSWDQNPGMLEQARDPNHKQWAVMGQAFVYFRAFAQGRVSDEIMGKIEARFEELKGKGSTWLWPTDEDVQEYVKWTSGEGQMEPTAQ